MATTIDGVGITFPDATQQTTKATSSGRGIFGDGNDGDITIAADTTLSRDMFYNNLTVDAGIVLTTDGYRIFVKGTLTNNGTIWRNGHAGTNATATAKGVGGAALGAGSLGASGKGGDGGEYQTLGTSHGGGGGSGGGVILIVAKSIVNNGTISANGGNGGNANGTGGGATNVSREVGGGVTASLGGSGGAGGDGGSSGGAGGTATAPTAAQGGYRAVPFAILLKDETTKFTGGGGGGGGDYGIAQSKAGGGGGGGGGLIMLIYESLTAGTETVTAGAGGIKYGTGTDGANGSAGTVIKISAV